MQSDVIVNALYKCGLLLLLFHPSDIGELLMTVYFYINVFIIILVPRTAIHLVYIFLIVVQGMPMNTSSMSQVIALR